MNFNELIWNFTLPHASAYRHVLFSQALPIIFNMYAHNPICILIDLTICYQKKKLSSTKNFDHFDLIPCIEYTTYKKGNQFFRKKLLFLDLRFLDTRLFF